MKVNTRNVVHVYIYTSKYLFLYSSTCIYKSIHMCVLRICVLDVLQMKKCIGSYTVGLRLGTVIITYNTAVIVDI